MPSARPGIGSPNTRIPPAIAEMFAAALVTAITGTASPSWKDLAEAKKATKEATSVSASHGLRSPSTPWAPTIPVRALIEISEAPKMMPLAAPSMLPWWWVGAPARGPAISSAPKRHSTSSKPIIAAGEKLAWAVRTAGTVSAKATSPAAVAARPNHCRRPTGKPKTRSAITPISTMPPASTTCTMLRGMSAMAATCSTHATAATSMPTANQRTRKSARPERQRGWRASTRGATTAPRCLKKNARFVTIAQASASRIPSWMVSSP